MMPKTGRIRRMRAGREHTVCSPSMKKRSRLTQTAILVRTHNPTPAMIERIRGWAHSTLHAGCSAFVVSMDVTYPPGMAAALSLDHAVAACGAVVHTYTDSCARLILSWTSNAACEWTLARKAAGKIGSLRQRWHGDSTWRPSTCACATCSMGVTQRISTIYGVRDGRPPLCALPPGPPLLQLPTPACQLRRMLQAVHRAAVYAVIEDDVGFTGALEELCAAYVEEAADLIGAAPVPVHAGAAEDADNSWCWTHMGSDAFLAAVPLALRLKVAEHVQRFSRRALDAMHALATGAQRLPSSGGQLPRRSRRRALTVRGEGATLGTSTPSTPPIDGKPAYRTSECVSAWSESAHPSLYPATPLAPQRCDL